MRVPSGDQVGDSLLALLFVFVRRVGLVPFRRRAHCNRSRPFESTGIASARMPVVSSFLSVG